MFRILTLKGITLFAACCIVSGCRQKPTEGTPNAFTQVDSLTEVYLDLQDSILQTWNLMMHDDNQKIKHLHSLLHELRVTGHVGEEQIASLEVRIGQLKEMRYTPKTADLTQTVDEYDFASTSLVSEIVALAESHPAYSYNSTMQQLVEEIRAAELRVEGFRATYDAVVTAYNNFLVQHRDHMHDIDPNNALEKKPLFQLATD